MPWLALSAVLLTVQPRKLDFYTEGPYNTQVPRIEAMLGYEPGTRISTLEDQRRVMDTIASTSGGRVKVWEYGKSTQGRALRLMAFGTPENIRRLDEIREAHNAIKRGEKPALANPPVLVWINQVMHGNEPASFDSAMYLAYTLAASRSPRVTEMLRHTVVIVNPVYNPDGYTRFATWYNSIARGQSTPGSFELQEPNIIHGRTNHYRFDMNRDRVSFSQDETRQEFREFLRWNPPIYVDQHGQVGTYFFPPEPMSVNANVDRARNFRWTDAIGRVIGKRFDELGFQYFVKDDFDLYYPGYVDSSTTLSGSIGMTHETDGGKYLATERADGSVLTLRRGIEKHFVSALAVIEACAKNRPAILESAREFAANVGSGRAAGKFQRVVVVARDSRPLRRLQKQLEHAGIVARFARQAWQQSDANNYWTGARETQTFPAGSLVIDMAQPQGAFAKALLEPGNNFEPEFIQAQLNKRKTAPEGEEYPGPEGVEFYDLTGWALPYAHNLAAWWCESAPATPLAESPSVSRPTYAKSTVGYVVRYQDQDDILAVAEALMAGVRGSYTTRAFRTADGEVPAGSFLFVADRNDEGYDEKLFEALRKRNVPAIPLTSSYPLEERWGPGAKNVVVMRKPKIGVIFGTGTSLADVSGIWYTLDRVFGIPFTALSTNALSGDLSSYTCLIVPAGAQVSASGRVREWVQNGGTLIAFDNIGWALGSSGFTELSRVSGEPQDLPGALFRASVDPRSPLSYGYPVTDGKITISVPIAGSTFFRRKPEGGSIVTLGPASETKLLTGWAWPDDTEKNLADTVWLQDAPVGRGHAILFTNSPVDRAMWPGLHPMLLNSMFLMNASGL